MTWSPLPGGTPVTTTPLPGGDRTAYRTVTLCVQWGSLHPSPHLLGPAEWAVAYGFPEQRRLEWLRGRVTARAALALHTPAPHGDCEVLADAAGAPVLHGSPGRRWRISLAHSGDLFGCAVAPAGSPVGVDVERADRRNRRLLPRLLTAGEPDTLDPTLVVACKEAACKAWRVPGVPLRLFRLVSRADRLLIRPPGPAPCPLFARASRVGANWVVTVGGSPLVGRPVLLTGRQAVELVHRAFADRPR